MNSSQTVTACAHGRVSLVGDHLDWLGGRAVTFAARELPVHATATRSLKPSSIGEAIGRALLAEGWDDIPVGIDVRFGQRDWRAAGLGSSGAEAVAALQAFSLISQRPLIGEDLARAAIAYEQLSGVETGQMDQYSAALGGFRSYWFAAADLVKSERLELPNGWVFLVVDSGQHRRSGTVLSSLRNAAHPTTKELFVKRSIPIADAITAELLKDGPRIVEVGTLMTEAHRALIDLGVSTRELDTLVERLVKFGAAGAKLTGAGNGGSVVALVARERLAPILDWLERSRLWCRTLAYPAGPATGTAS